MNGYKPSSQTIFLPRQDAFFATSFIPNRHFFSSRGPALRAALASPPAVGPDGPRDLRDFHPDTTVVLPVSSVVGERSAVRRWQDKAVLTDGPPASSQPGPDTIVARSSVSDTGSARSQNHSDAKERLVKGAVWMKPGVKETLECLADQTGLSFSATAAEGLEVYARAKLQDQQETLFEPKMRTMMRREIRSSDDRHVPFEIKNAIASEQTRIYTADMYKRVLLKEGFSQKEINKKLDVAYNLACDNVFNTKTPKFTALLQRYWAMTEELPDRQTGKIGESHTEPSDRGAAGKGKPNV